MSERYFESPAPKTYRMGTARTRTPTQTFEILQPSLARFGITRLANITGLDRIGIPVWQAIRPNSRSLSVSQGKGLDAVSAKVSALMESLESFHAEWARCPVRLESHAALKNTVKVLELECLPLSRNSRFHPYSPIPWTPAKELGSRDPVFVPFECVHTNYTLPRVPGSGDFAVSTSGLGSGNHLAEGVLHGVCELIERDAETLWHLRGPEHQATTRVDNSSVDNAAAREILQAYASAGIETMIWDMSSNIEVASFTVIIFDPNSDSVVDPCPAANGSGCHPDRGIALCRALTEAAQSRLTTIAGSRDDLTLAGYAAAQSDRSLEYYRGLLSASCPRRYQDAPNWVGETIDADLGFVRTRLAENDLNQILFVDLSSTDLDLAFVRTLVPGLEGSIESPSYRPRARGLQVIA